MKIIKKIFAAIVFMIAMTFATWGTYSCFSSGIIGAICLPFNILIVFLLSQWINHLNRDDEEE